VVEAQVPRFIDNAHAAVAEYRLHLVAGNTRQASGGRRGRDPFEGRTCSKPRK
jgi:hypothetical protein